MLLLLGDHSLPAYVVLHSELIQFLLKVLFFLLDVPELVFLHLIIDQHLRALERARCFAHGVDLGVGEGEDFILELG